MRPSLLALAFLLPISSPAQTRPLATGSVSGSIVCADTNLPAHYATVALEPVRDVASPSEKTSKSIESKAPAMITLARTHLDGSFQVAAVKPGRYYVVVQNPGYLSPASQFTQKQIEHPTAELKEAIEKVVPIITVGANANSTITLSLARASSISGTLRFEDGSPAAGLSFEFERKDPDGKFIPVNLDTTGPDDQGHFRASGVPTGEYRMFTTLSVNIVQVDGVFGGQHSMAASYGGGLAIYYGDTFHKKDARVLKIEGGESLQADITIPSSKIHSITGALVDAKTGHAINAGTVAIAEPEETDPFIASKVDPDQPTFRIEYAPEGSYTIRVKDARDVAREEIPYPAGTYGTRNFKETVLKRYQPYDAPLLVQTDQSSLNLPMTPVKPGATLSASPASEN